MLVDVDPIRLISVFLGDDGDEIDTPSLMDNLSEHVENASHKKYL